ncbi:MAG: helix-turn-helix transcriptional regulator, partial [Pseudomonadota bacterium]
MSEFIARKPQATDDNINDLMRKVGERVRKARELRGLPRRLISETSGVSPRYLAQLEAGNGNISIGLLQKIATALDHRIEWFVGDEDPWASEALHVADLYRSAPTAVRQRVMEALSPEPPEVLRARRICLIGLRGAGKSTLGAMAGEALGIPFVELNRHIEDHAGMPVNEIYALYGQEGYRSLEAEAVEQVINTHNCVILAVAGGIVAEPDNYITLLARFHTVWLKASPDEHMERVLAQGDMRPMAGNPEAMDQLKALVRRREGLDDGADALLDSSRRSLEKSRVYVLAVIRKRRFL